jgi:Domain of unknown function (DUF1929)
VNVRPRLVVALLASWVLFAPSAAGAQTGTPSADQTPAERIAAETQAAARAAEQGGANTSLAPSPSAGQQRAAAAADPRAGRWTSCELPVGFNPVHASVLPDGSVLLMAGSGNNAANFQAGNLQSFVFFPDTCTTVPVPTPSDVFCSGHTSLPNGNVLVAGGTAQYDPFHGLRTSYEYDWINRRFVPLPPMARGRWYPSAAELGNGDVFVISGLDGSGGLAKRAEIYNYRARTWSDVPYDLSVPTYPNMLPATGGRLFLTGVGFGTSAHPVGFLRPRTGEFQAVGGLDTNKRDQGASFFVPNTQGRQVMVAGGGVATTALIDLYASSPSYRAGPTLSTAPTYLSHATLFDGRVLLAGGQDPQKNPIFTTQLYQPSTNSFEPSAPASGAHQYHSNMWVDRAGRAILVGGNPSRSIVQRLVERYEPWYVDVPDRPAITAAPRTIVHGQSFGTSVRLATGTTLKRLRLFRLASTTHQYNAAEGDFSLTPTNTPTGTRWTLTLSADVTPPGYYYLVAVDSRDVPSVAKIVQVT